MAIIQDAIGGQPQQDPTQVQLPPNASAPAASPLNGPLTTPSIAGTTAPAANSVAQLGQPQSWGVTPDQTVEGRIQSIISANSPIIQMARTKALETANGRGLLNSSMAVQAGEAAAFGAATPIAQADAATAAKAASYNADEANQFGIKNQDALNTRSGQVLTSDTQKMIAGLQRDTQLQVQQMQNDNQKLLQTNNQAATAFNQALVSMTSVNMNDKMDAYAKTQAIAQIQRDLQGQLRVLGSTSGLNLTSQLNFAGYDGFDGSGNYVGFGGGGGSTDNGGTTANVPGLPPGIPSAGATPTGQPLPARSSTGVAINWNQPNQISLTGKPGFGSLLEGYNSYADWQRDHGHAAMSPSDWWDTYAAPQN